MSLCLSIPQVNQDFEQIDRWAKANGQTVVFAPWHPNPEFRVFKTGSLLSRNDEYPSGLVIVELIGREAVPIAYRSEFSL